MTSRWMLSTELWLYCRVKGANKKHLDPDVTSHKSLWLPQNQVEEFYQSLRSLITEFYQSLGVKFHQFLNLLQNQAIKIHQSQTTLKNSAAPETLYKFCTLFSLLLPFILEAVILMNYSLQINLSEVCCASIFGRSWEKGNILSFTSINRTVLL